MSALEIGKQLVQFCQLNKDLESINTLYSPNVVSVEPGAPEGMDRTNRGLDAIRGKYQWWTENHDVHKVEAHGPYPHGNDKFAVHFVYDVTNKPSGKRFQMDEIGVFEVADDKVVREEYFYTMS